MEIHPVQRAILDASTSEELRRATPPEGLKSFFEHHDFDPASFRQMTFHIKKLDPREGEALQELFDRRFALDSLHPEVRGGVLKAAKSVQISDVSDLAYRLHSLLSKCSSAEEAIAVVKAGHRLTRSQILSIAAAAEGLSLNPIDLSALLSQRESLSDEELQEMARQLASLK